MRSTIRAIAMLVFSPFLVFAQQDTNKDGIAIVKPTPNFDISGSGNSPEWQVADWIMLEKRKGSVGYNTRAKLLYSETGIYVLFYCQDSRITATLKEDYARLWTEDVVEIFLWPDESFPLYFEYELSPLNYELPILVPNMDGDFLGWRPWQYEGERKVRHATTIERGKQNIVTAWMAEFFIPYALLKPLRNVPPGKESTWRMNLYRNDFDEGTASWSWRPYENGYHDYKNFGMLKFD